MRVFSLLLTLKTPFSFRYAKRRDATEMHRTKRINFSNWICIHFEKDVKYGKSVKR